MIRARQASPAIFSAAVVLLAACAGPTQEAKKSVAQLMAAGDYGAAAAAIEARRDQYGDSNFVLYELDFGMALHLAGQYAESALRFELAERRMDELYTRSVSRMAGALVANENTEEYRGRPHDRALSHLFHALDCVALGQGDEALVEVRRLEAFLQERTDSESNSVAYRDDAFGHYLSALLYEDAGMTDDARISHDDALRTYRGYAARYGVSVPDFPFPSRLGADGEVDVLFQLGPAPRLISVAGSASAATPPSASTSAPQGLAGALMLPFDVAGKIVSAVGDVVLNTAHPEYVQDAFRARSAAVDAGASTCRAQIVEDVFAIARLDLAERLSALKARSTARAALKLAGTVTGLDATGSEFADVRSWQTLPSRLLLARLRLPPGERRLTLRYLDASGAEILRRERTVVVRPGRRVWVVDKTTE